VQRSKPLRQWSLRAMQRRYWVDKDNMMSNKGVLKEILDRPGVERI